MKALLAVVGVVVLGATCFSQDSRQASPSLLKARFGNLPVYFIENRDVYPDQVAYYVHGGDKTLFFTKDGITFLLKGKDRGWVVKLEFVGANPDVVPKGEDLQHAVFSRFKGPRKDWRTGLRTFARVAYQDLWPGIDLVYNSAVNRLKYEFVVKPGADPGQIGLRYRGTKQVEATESGGLRVETPVGGFTDSPPVAFQKIDGEQVSVDAAFAVNDGGDDGERSFGFRLGHYDRTTPLILDPAIFVYCGYIGGARLESGWGIAVDAAGNTYVTGVTNSSHTTFPVKAGPDLTFNDTSNRSDAFVAKVNAQGTALVYCGYIGGALYDGGVSIAIDAAGNAYVTGSTYSNHTTFPVTAGPDLTFNDTSAGADGFVARVNAQGTGLDYCGYIGGAKFDACLSIAGDAAGNAYVTGYTSSDQTTFPVRVGPDLTFNDTSGASDAFVAKVSPQGAIVYCGYLGAAARDSGYAIAVDSGGSAYVSGLTYSDETTFPVKVGPDTSFNGNYDGFVAKVNASGASLDYCGYIGGSGSDSCWDVAVDGAGQAYLVGHTFSDETTFPVRVGPDLTFNDTSNYGDAFVAKVNASGAALVYCGYIGGAENDEGRGIAVDGRGAAHVIGQTKSSEKSFPVRVGPGLIYHGTPPYLIEDAFVAKVTSAGDTLVYCGYIGGTSYEIGTGIAVDAAGDTYVVGGTRSDETTFPVHVGPALVSGGNDEAFVAKFSPDLVTASGTPRPGGTIHLALTSADPPGLPYQLGSSLGTGPISIGSRSLGLGADDLLAVSVSNCWPWIFSGYGGILDRNGQATAACNIPNVPVLVGTRIHSAFVTIDARAPQGIRSISNTETFTISK